MSITNKTLNTEVLYAVIVENKSVKSVDKKGELINYTKDDNYRAWVCEEISTPEAEALGYTVPRYAYEVLSRLRLVLGVDKLRTLLEVTVDTEVELDNLLRRAFNLLKVKTGIVIDNRGIDWSDHLAI